MFRVVAFTHTQLTIKAVQENGSVSQKSTHFRIVLFIYIYIDRIFLAIYGNIEYNMCVYYLYRYSIFLYTYSCNIYIYIHTYMYIHLYSGSAIHVHIEMEFLQNPQIWSKAFLQGHREATTDGFLFWCRKWQVDALIRYIRIYVWRYTVYIHICVKIHV